MEKIKNRENQKKQHGDDDGKDNSLERSQEPDVAKISKIQGLHFLKTKLSEQQIKFAFDQLKTDAVAKLVGILAHFVYWSVFGGFNNLPIDDYHMEKMLKTILEQLKGVEEASIKSSVDNFVLQRSKKEKEKGNHEHDHGHGHGHGHSHGHSEHNSEDHYAHMERLNLPDMKLIEAKKNAKNLY